VVCNFGILHSGTSVKVWLLMPPTVVVHGTVLRILDRIIKSLAWQYRIRRLDYESQIKHNNLNVCVTTLRNALRQRGLRKYRAAHKSISSGLFGGGRMSVFQMNLTFITIQGLQNGYYAIVESDFSQIAFKRGSKLAPVNSMYGPALDGTSKAT
jgi:hypothetical protein